MKSATITNIELPLFRKQRAFLIKMIFNPRKYNLSKENEEHVTGILHLTDNIFDQLMDDKPVKLKKHKCGAALEAKELFYGHCLACGEDI